MKKIFLMAVLSLSAVAYADGSSVLSEAVEQMRQNVTSMLPVRFLTQGTEAQVFDSERDGITYLTHVLFVRPGQRMSVMSGSGLNAEAFRETQGVKVEVDKNLKSLVLLKFKASQHAGVNDYACVSIETAPDTVHFVCAFANAQAKVTKRVVLDLKAAR